MKNQAIAVLMILAGAVATIHDDESKFDPCWKTDWCRSIEYATYCQRLSECITGPWNSTDFLTIPENNCRLCHVLVQHGQISVRSAGITRAWFGASPCISMFYSFLIEKCEKIIADNINASDKIQASLMKPDEMCVDHCKT